MTYLNIFAMLVAAFSALIIGFIWYNPKVFGNAWIEASGLTDEKGIKRNPVKIFALAFLFAFMLSTALPGIVIHQMGVLSLVGGHASEALPSYAALLVDYGDAFRTFKHGVFHGMFAGIFIALPIIGTNALFERKSAKYILIHSGYWIVTFAVMGGILSAWK